MPESITTERVRKLVSDSAQLVEVLPREDYEPAHLPEAINIPLKELSQETVGSLDRERPVIVYCADELCDMSPRAAWRLESLGFDEVYDYVAGKAAWLGYGLPYEGDLSDRPSAGDEARTDVAVFGLEARASEVERTIGASPYGFGLVVNGEGVVLGRVRKSSLREAEPLATADELMEPGPSTVRPHQPLDKLLDRLREQDLSTAIVTDLEGRLVGVVSRDRGER